MCFRRGNRRFEPPHVDADGEDFDGDGSSVIVQPNVPSLGLVVEAEEPGAAGEEMAGVIEGMEADEVGVEERAEELVSNRQGAEDFRRGERGMEEKSELYPREAFAEEGGEGEEVVVVGPDEVVLGGEDFRDPVGEDLVGGEIGEPEAAVVADAGEGGGGEGEEVVEHRPEVALAESMVESLVEVGREEDRDAVEFLGEALGDGVVVGGVDVGAEGPDVDDGGGGREAGAELEGDGVGVPGERPLAGRRPAAGAEGEVVGDDDAALGRGRGRGEIGGGGIGVGVGEEARQGQEAGKARRLRRRRRGDEGEEIGVGAGRHRGGGGVGGKWEEITEKYGGRSDSCAVIRRS